jgi:hypothetical protein
VSYGRHPYYITREGTDGGEVFVFYDGTDSNGSIPAITYDAMAQFVASMWRRDHDLEQLADLHGELAELIERGLTVRPQLRDDAYWQTRTIKLTNEAGVTESSVTIPDPG